MLPSTACTFMVHASRGSVELTVGLSLREGAVVVVMMVVVMMAVVSLSNGPQMPVTNSNTMQKNLSRQYYILIYTFKLAIQPQALHACD